MSKRTAAVLAAIESTRVAPGADKLQAVRDKIQEARDLTMEIEDLEERLQAKESELQDIVGGGQKPGVLCDMFNEIGISELKLERQGNVPAYRAEIQEFYSAAIPKEPEAASKALRHIEKVWRMPGLIKTMVEVRFGKGEREKAQRLEAFLRKSKHDFHSKSSVHASTLTAEIRRRYKSGSPLSPGDLSTVGGYVGTFMKLSKED